MSARELGEAADENLATHFTWVQRQTAGMRAAVGKDLVRTECGMDCDTFNAVFRARLTPGATARKIDGAIAWFSGRPFSWWVGPADAPWAPGRRLGHAGRSSSETEPAMAASIAKLRETDAAPEGLVIRRVATRRGLADYASVQAANWWPPDEVVIRFYELGAPVLLSL